MTFHNHQWTQISRGKDTRPMLYYDRPNQGHHRLSKVTQGHSVPPIGPCKSKSAFVDLLKALQKSINMMISSAMNDD